MSRQDVAFGAAIGYALPWLVLAPALFAQRLDAYFVQGRVVLLLPWLFLLAIPAGIAGSAFAAATQDRRRAWRFAAGILLGGSLAGSVLVAASASSAALASRVGMVAFGGTFLAGFWLWLGTLMGLAVEFNRSDPKPQPTA